MLFTNSRTRASTHRINRKVMDDEEVDEDADRDRRPLEQLGSGTDSMKQAATSQLRYS